MPAGSSPATSHCAIDLQLLNDAEIIRLPVNQWPIPRAAVQYALSNAKEHFATNAAVSAALARVQCALEPADTAASRVPHVRRRRCAAASPACWRDFDTLAREDGELRRRR